jgi:microcystin-dependent protein
MATVTPGYNWTSGETVTPAKLNSAAAPTVVVADGEVTTSKIADGAVTDVKLASGIDASKLTTGTLPIARIADSSVTQAKLASGVGIPAGAVMPFAMNSAPAGWLAADGSNVNRTTYAALFTAISTTYGAGDGSTTFTLPDLRGYFVRGSGTNSDGTAAGTFGAKQADALQGHRHSLSNGSLVWRNTGGPSLGGTGASSAFNLSVGDPTADGTNGTPRTASETRPANIALLYCIKF